MPSLSTKVTFHFLIRPLYFPKRKKLKLFIEQIFKKEGKNLKRLSYTFCSDDYLLKINQVYLNHDYYTDILTFDFSETKEIIGEVYISIDRVKENAHIYNSGIISEIQRVVFHGALHLCGYDDKSAGMKNKMRAREDYYLANYPL